MSEEFYGKGIIVASGFDLSAKSPLDTRSIVNTIEERNAHVTGNRVYEGMKVYVLAEKKEYRYNGNDWEEVGGITDEQLEQLTIAYEHSQTPHVTEEYVDAKIAEASLSGEVDLSNYATKTDLNSKVDKIEGKGLSTNDYTNEEKNKLNGIEEGANNYIHPTEHEASMIIEDVEHRFVTDEEKNRWNNKSDFDGDYNNLTNKPNIPTKTSELENDSDFTTNSYVNEMLGGKKLIYLTQAEYDILTEAEKNDENVVYNITDSSEEYVTKTELESKGYLTEHQDISGKVDKVEGKSLISDTEIERLANVDNYDDTEIRAELNNKANISDLHQHANKEVLDGITADKVTSWDNKSDFDGDYNSLTNKPTIPSKTSELVNDSTYVTESGVLEIIENSGGIGGATEVSQGETEPTEESVLLWIDTTSDENMVENNLSNSLITEFQDSISTLNTRVSTLEKNIKPPFGEDAHTHSNKVVLDKITQAQFDKWNNKSDFNGSYNSLTDKPTIPTRTSQLVNDSNYVTTAEMNQAIADIPTGEQVDLTNYQTKTDNTLNTTDKTVIGAINEINSNLGNKVNSSQLNTAISSYVAENRDELKGDKGDKGDTGAKGDKGDKGDTGAKGQDGITPTLSIGTVTTGNAGSNASVTMTGNSPNYTLNFIIPKGDKGDSGSSGNVDLTNYQTKTDNSLNTTNKTIVGAINEVKTNLGNKSDTNHTHSQYITSSSIPTSLPANGGNANTVGGYTIWVGTQAEYDAIGSKSSTTIYFIKG